MTKCERLTEEGDCGIPDSCTRQVPAWLVALDNAPTITMFILGGVLLWFIWWPFTVAFLVYCALSIILFWGTICPYCSHYDTKACPCGYGVVAPKFFKRRKGDFKKIFKVRLSVMYPCWIVPFIAGAYLLWTSFNWTIVAIFVAFCIIGFAMIPMISKYVGCAGCEIKDKCPWMDILDPLTKVKVEKKRACKVEN